MEFTGRTLSLVLLGRVAQVQPHPRGFGRTVAPLPATHMVSPICSLSRTEFPVGPKRSLKVHKNEIFFGFDFEFCTISMLVMHK